MRVPWLMQREISMRALRQFPSLAANFSRRGLSIPLLGGVDAEGGRGGLGRAARAQGLMAVGSGLVASGSCFSALTTPSASPPPLLGGEFISTRTLRQFPSLEGWTPQADGVVRGVRQSSRLDDRWLWACGFRLLF